MSAYLSPVEVTVLVPAGPSDVFGFFTDPARYVQWMGNEASLEPVPGPRPYYSRPYQVLGAGASPPP